MIPITRKELYLNKIVGSDNYDIPEKPITTEEFFFAEILGEAVQAPEPLTRYQMFLAKIAGREIEIPYPETRLEYFLAKAAGMEIETPTPITREEILWSNYSAIVDFEVEGVPPLTYKAIEGTLENYRIYGNTVGGESVGDRTANLFDISTIVEGKYISSSGVEEASTAQYQEYVLNHTDFINISSNTNYSLLYNAPYNVGLHNIIAFCWFDSNKTLISRSTKSIEFYSIDTYSFSATSPSNAVYLIVNFIGYVDRATYMLNTGSEPLPYEPYGYLVPVTVTNGMDTETTNIYLPGQIKMVGDEAEYIDYGEQKMHRIGADDIDVTLLALPTLTGTNVLSVGTAVQPSKVYVKGTKEREYT